MEDLDAMIAGWERARGIGPDPVAPRATELLELLGEQDPETWWADRTANGAPIVEPDPESDSHRLVTFLWRGTPGVDRVELVNPVAHLDLTALTSGRMPGQTRWAAPLRRHGDSDVWARTYRLPADLRVTYGFREIASADAAPGIGSIGEQPDPLNPVVHPAHRRYPESPSYLGLSTESVLALDAAPDPVRGLPPGPSGEVVEWDLTSTIHPSTRRVWTHVPAGMDPDGLPVLLVHDGFDWAAHSELLAMIDTLVAAGRVRPMVTCLVEALRREPGELGCNEPFARAMAEELLAQVRTRWPVSTSREDTWVAGQSWGGLHAAYCGLVHADVFGTVISQSGSFWEGVGTTGWEDYGRLIGDYARAPLAPVRFHLDVGSLEGEQVAVNRHLRDVLVAKGYEVHYREFSGGHSWAPWQYALVDALETLSRERPDA